MYLTGRFRRNEDFHSFTKHETAHFHDNFNGLLVQTHLFVMLRTPNKCLFLIRHGI